MRQAVGTALIAVLLFLAACAAPAYPRVSLVETGAPSSASNPDGPLKLPLRVAIAAVISPQATLDAYGPLLDYLAARLDRPVQLMQRGTYAEINELIRSGRADLAFVCGGAYVEGQREFGMELLVAPEVRGETAYFSYLIVPRDSPARSLADLRGRSFAFSDPLSNSGHLAPQWLLHQMGETPDAFFSSTFFTYSHDNSIRAVADHLADGAAVDSLVYDYTIARDPTFSRRTRVIGKSGPFGIPPVVVHPDLDPALKEQLRAVLLGMADDPTGHAALDRLMIDRFVTVDESAYDSIREMAAIIRNWHETP
ncbi:MAG: phosphate/phosphite/phosphonate ABC transporter substrate-binding protein [Chloroflexi bacterium]|nr:phosphate/phosphite/phosphonate ABC transporter substrate-binding protein [Chloroflexota bacterium]